MRANLGPARDAFLKAALKTMPRSQRRMIVNFSDDMSDLKLMVSAMQKELASLRQAPLESSEAVALVQGGEDHFVKI